MRTIIASILFAVAVLGCGAPPLPAKARGVEYTNMGNVPKEQRPGYVAPAPPTPSVAPAAASAPVQEIKPPPKPVAPTPPPAPAPIQPAPATDSSMVAQPVSNIVATAPGTEWNKMFALLILVLAFVTVGGYFLINAMLNRRRSRKAKADETPKEPPTP